MMRRFLVAVALFLALLSSSAGARAHDFEPGVLVLVETTAGRFDIAWSEPVDSQGSPGGVRAVFPQGCTHEAKVLDCGGPLRGTISFEGMHESRMQVIVIVKWLDGTAFERLVGAKEPRIEVAPGPGRDAFTWISLGIEHIGIGFDHIAFVIGLLLVVGFNRRLVATITAFTAAHSVTLALAATGTLELPSRSVEAAIAASVVLVAREGMHDRQTFARRWPWLVALLFGLVHGLGFAGALGELGLPRDGAAFALLFFNVGVELGQLALVALAFVLVAIAGKRLRNDPRPRLAACYVVGGLGAWWWVERTIGILLGRA
jgi:hypothetical protein